MAAVDAVKTLDEVRDVARLLKKHRGEIYSDLWVFGVNVALRISDLLPLTMEQAKSGMLELQEGKTGKLRKITLNDTAKAIVNKRIVANPDHIYLFQVDSNRARNKPLSRSAVSKAFAEVGEILDIQLGTHSMRKTLGWVMHSQGASIERVCKVLNHSHPAVTMRYIGLTDADTQAAYSEFEIRI
ncbi:tyrosine-type recombinase/integrase [Spongiibacter taiwanensis]|uniref:tyrosine-type recombinase/integrase n=1 Tax=Spongiibacter taiwanensis TaxID=1748242 RepID=UPI002035929A|nr:tyrosine-type recombinase/integrase [Spongiibacter taiwanensis]USA44724.1 tyrosine-type recombinase/integrase [Spongiibacter taiwanensis]